MKNLILLFTGLMCVVAAHAESNPGEVLLNQSQVLFHERSDLSKVEELISVLKQSEAVIAASDEVVKYQLVMLLGRGLYFKATHAALSKSDKLALLEEAMGQFTATKSIKDMAESYMWYASALGRWAETKGITESLGRKDELMRELQTAMEKSTLKGESGKVVEGWGPNRILGRMFAKLPFFAGGSRSKAKQNLDLAYSNAPHFPLNVIYRAELYSSGSAEEKAEACRSLAELLSLDPKSLDPERVPENLEEFEDALKLKNQICN